MLYSIMMIDKPDSENLRAQTSSQHREYVGKNMEGMRIGGPMLADDNVTITGSLIVKEFPDKAAAEAFAAAEPYNKAGLFEIVIIRPIRIAVENSEVIPVESVQ